MNEENLNGSMSAILAGCPGLNFNNDIQIPYRFPIIDEIHDANVCIERCWQDMGDTEMVLAAQTQQNAQAGYAADYQNKRSAQSFNEVKEAKRGHHALAETNLDKRTSYIGHRHVTRILSDYYGRGIVRSNQESTNLRAYSRAEDVTAAEAIKTNKNVNLPAAGALKLVERMTGCAKDFQSDGNKIRMEYDDRDKRNIRIVSKNSAYLYAFRPLQDSRAAELPYLSLYEFFRYWRIELAAYVVSDKDIGNEEDECYHARLTVADARK
jgi:hypothetical protein